MIQVDTRAVPVRRPEHLGEVLRDRLQNETPPVHLDRQHTDESGPIYVSPPPVPWPRVFPGL